MNPRALTKRQSKSSRKSGQAIIFLMMVLVIGTLAVLWNFDVHNITSTKLRITNAGDAGALSAARWQGITLNMIGEMNLVQAAYACDNMVSDITDSNLVEQLKLEVENMAILRSRLSLVGPLMGMVAAQAAALQNLSEKDQARIEDNASGYMSRRAEDFVSSGGSYQGVVDAPYTGAWEEYGELLAAIAESTMIVDCANTEFFLFYESNHILLNPDFYDAVAGGYWCRFKNGSFRTLLESYNVYTDWSPLPPLSQETNVNSEYFGTDLRSWATSLNWYYTQDDPSTADVYEGGNYPTRLTNYYPNLELDGFTELRDQFVENAKDTAPLDGAELGFIYDMLAINFQWHYYEWSQWLQNRWSSTGQYFPDSSQFKFHEGWRVKDEYNYGGANAAVDCFIDAANITPNMRISTDWIQWQAAAKPFGYLENLDNPDEPRSPVHFGLVLPAFRDARLIHNGVSTRKTGVSQRGYDEHIYEHLPEYMPEGLPGIEDNDDCFFCDQLRKWEEADFRESGIDWLEKYEDSCQGISGGGSTSG